MDIDRYLADNQPAWAEFDRLAETVRRHPARLGDDELERFLHLHLRTSADLSHARVAQPEPALVDRLSHSVAAGRTVLEGRKAVSLRTVGRFFTVRFPTAVWRLRRLVAVSAALTFVPAVATGLWIERSPAALEALAPPALRDAYVNEDFEEYYSDRPASQFATEVTVNNIRVSVMTFAGGMLLGLGTAAILIFNGMNVGFAAGLFAAADQSARFYGLLLPHGLLELTAVVIAGATGLSLGWAMIAPGDRTRSESSSLRHNNL
ncbi:MAG: stage II sporulation protein M [Acidimicrobiales bacterium]